MKRRGKIAVVAITALLTFGGLVGATGKMYKHHMMDHSEQCSEDNKKHHKHFFWKDKTENETEEKVSE